MLIFVSEEGLMQKVSHALMSLGYLATKIVNKNVINCVIVLIVLVYFSVGMRNEKASRTRYVHILFDLDLPGAQCFLNTFRKILVCPPLGA